MSNMQPINTETARLFVDLDKPSLAGLAFALRHPETWPKGFSWNYDSCDRCAMGLACRLWAQIEESDVSAMAREFAMPYEVAWQIFQDANTDRFHVIVERFRTARWFGLVDQFEDRTVSQEYTRFDITPEMVADDIDNFLSQRKA